MSILPWKDACCLSAPGFASMTVPIYIAESAPVHLRGRLVTVNTLFITGGQFIASVVDGALSYVKPDGWRYGRAHTYVGVYVCMSASLRVCLAILEFEVQAPWN